MINLCEYFLYDSSETVKQWFRAKFKFDIVPRDFKYLENSGEWFEFQERVNRNIFIKCLKYREYWNS